MDQILALIAQVQPALVALAVVTLADLVTGIAGAVRNGTFDPSQIGKFISSHVVGRVFPIATLIVLGTQNEGLAALAATASAAYVLETVKSVSDNLQAPAA